MNNRIVRTLALGLGLAAIFSTGTLNASTDYAERVNIPFEFKVGKRIFTAGQYRIEQIFGKDIAYVVNTQTGQRFQVLRPTSSRTPGKGKFTFENSYGVRVLKSLS